MKMSRVHREALVRAVTPSRAEIVRAKVLIMARLVGGQSSTTGELSDVLNIEAGIVNTQDSGTRIHLPPSGEAWEPDPDAEPIARQRNHWAARVAIDELTRRGVIAERKKGAVVFPISQGSEWNSTGWNERIEVDKPAIVEACVALDNEQVLGVDDVDLFTADLGLLRLDPRTLRCLEEALTAHRHGLYLGAVSLLGAVSEGAWYAAGEQLRDSDERLARALDNDHTAKVTDLVCELMRRVGRLKTIANELHAHAAYLRDLRNYGVHPREAINTSREVAFTESASMCLILQTHRYLERLAEAVATLTAKTTEADELRCLPRRV